MSYRMLACDYDRTLATAGVIPDATVEALRDLRHAGYLLGMVTGREFDNLVDVCASLGMFDLVVAENGAVVQISGGEPECLGEPPPPEFFSELRRLEVPFSAGRVVVGSVRPHEHALLATIKAMGLELEIVFNKLDVMVLPAGISKATGLRVGLDRMSLTAAQVIGVGDAENDHAFLRMSGYGVAVANALESLKREADLVTEGAEGAGVVELIREYLLVGRDLPART